MKKLCFLAMTCLVTSVGSFLGATELQPWFGKELEFSLRPSYSYQGFKKIQTPKGTVASKGWSQTTGLSLSLISAQQWSGEVELDAVNTRKRHLGFDSGKVTARYLLLDDVKGDPVSLTGGATVGFVSSRWLKDPSVIRHGNANVEGHLAVGKELSNGPVWTYHFWAMMGLGLSNKGSGWGRLSLNVEKNIQEKHRIALFSEGSEGFGHRTLVLGPTFEGYSKVGYRAIDVGARYSYKTDFWGSFSLGYTRGVYARNQPEQANTLTFAYFFLFGV